MFYWSRRLLKFEAEGWEFEKKLGSLEQFFQTVKGQNKFFIKFEKIEFKLEKNIGI